MQDLKTNKFFDLSELKTPPIELRKESTFDQVDSAYLSHQLYCISGLNDLVRIPSEGEIFFLQTDKSFNAFTFLPWIAKRHFIQEIYASTYSIGTQVVEALQEMQQKGQINEVSLLISDSMIKRNPKTIEVLEAVIRHNPSFKVKYKWNHSKITLIKTEDFHIVLEGSGNWSKNAQIEQYVLLNNEQVYEFRKQIFL